MCFLEDVFADLPLVRVKGVSAALEKPVVISYSTFLVTVPSEFFSTERCFKFVLATVNSLVCGISPMNLILGWRSRAGAVRRL